MEQHTYNTMIPYVQLRTNAVICYSQYEGSRYSKKGGTSEGGSSYKMTDAFANNVENLKEMAKYTGQMTAGARKRLSKAISLLITSSPTRYEYSKITQRTSAFKLSFITLTLPDVEQAKDAKWCHKNMLEPILLFLRRYHSLKSYVWKCELQQNGSIHYHITSDCFIAYTDLRNQWNSLLNKHGLLVEFKAKYGHDNPNSIDIHSTREVRNMESYLIKYIAKEHQNQQAINAKIWDCSLNLKVAKYFKAVVDSVTSEAITRALMDSSADVIELETCTVIKFPSAEYVTYYFKHLMQDFIHHNKLIRTWQRVKEKTTKVLQQNCRKVSERLTETLQGYLFRQHPNGSYIYTD